MEMKNNLAFENQIAWLLNGDPAIRYHVYKDILFSDSATIELERGKITEFGWGRRLLDLQDNSGLWANAYYSPKWTSTFYTLLTLKDLGAKSHQKILKACLILLDKGFFHDGGINFWKSRNQSETCVTGMFLTILSHFNIKDAPLKSLAIHLLNQQMPDGGWNCESNRGAIHSSFHTTISVLEGLWEYQKVTESGHILDLKDAESKGIEFLLQHHLYKSHNTGKIVDPKMLKLTFPARWKYDIIRCLDYFQQRNQPKDPRMADALDVIKSKQTKEGFWNLEYKHLAKVFFDFEKVGQPSHWNTLRAIRVLNWWNESNDTYSILPIN
jgi:hypothetical protein